MPQQFPILEVSGNHVDLGRAIGTRFKSEIQARIALRRGSIPDYDQHLQKCQPYYQATKQHFPDLIEELTAIALAAQVSFEDLFFHNCREVYDFFATTEESGDHCTAIISQHDTGLIIGHNEDWHPSAINDLYILSANINNTKIFALANTSLLPGDCVMMNSHGLVQCINELHSSNQIGVPKNFVARAILECNSIDAATTIINQTQRASGFNHVLTQQDRIINVEITDREIDVMNIDTKTFVHTNHYLSPKLSPFEQYNGESSHKRQSTANKLLSNDPTPGNTTREEMFHLLRNTSDGALSICNDNTIASIVCIPHQNEIWLCYGKPSEGEYVKYTL